jgi:hypothetical protein
MRYNYPVNVYNRDESPEPNMRPKPDDPQWVSLT